MRKDVELLNCLSGLMESYSSPPWRLAGITAHPRGSLVMLVGDDGEKFIIPVMVQAEYLREMFSSWSDPA